MSVRSLMKHRATVERDKGTEPDPLGGHIPDWQQVHKALPCYVQARMERTVADGDKLVAIADYLFLAPLDADLEEEDIVTRVVNRRGKELVGQRLRMVGLVPREDHKEAALEEYS